MLKWVKDFLKVLELDILDLSLGISMLMFLEIQLESIKCNIVDFWVEKKVVITNSLMDTTIQDGGIRERSSGHIPLYHPKRKIKKNRLK